MNSYDSEQNEQQLPNRLKIEILEKLIQNGQPHFGVFSQVKDINYLDYYSHLISQKSLPNWRKHLLKSQPILFYSNYSTSL